MIPVTAQFEINDGCTHSCSYCYNGSHQNRNLPSNTRVAEAIAKSGVFDLTLTGGEPLLDKQFLYNAMDIFKKENVQYGINSNLHLFEEDDVKIFREKGVKSVLTSVLGSDSKTHEKMVRKKGSFKRLMKSLDLLADSGIYLGANMVITHFNKQQVYDTGKMLVERFGIKSFTATPAIPHYDAKDKKMLTREEHIEMLDDLLQVREDCQVYTGSLHPIVHCMFDDEQREKYEIFLNSKSCTSGRGSVAFSTKGDVRVCTQERNSYGNILVESLEKIIQRTEHWRKNKNIPEKCKPCDYYLNCRGGCRVASKSINGTLNSPEPYSREPIRNRKIKKDETIDFPNLKITNSDMRYRIEGDRTFIIYLNPNAYAQVTKTGLDVFRRYLAGKTFEEIATETGDREGIKKFSEVLFKSGLLKNDLSVAEV